MTDKELLDGLARCAVHQCPMIRIGDDHVCVVEYADEMLGMRSVADVTPGTATEPIVLEFDNGRSLPLLCACCGEPLQIKDADLLREEVVGLRLVAIGTLLAEGDQPDALEFILAPADMLDDLPQEIVQPLPERFRALALHLDSVRGIR